MAKWPVESECVTAGHLLSRQRSCVYKRKIPDHGTRSQSNSRFFLIFYGQRLGAGTSLRLLEKFWAAGGPTMRMEYSCTTRDLS